MPIYEYVCPACNRRFELLRSRSESNLGAPCPDCESSAERTMSSFSHYAATPADSALRKQDKMKDKMWASERKMEDDIPEAVKKRLGIYHDLTEPLLEYYRPRDIVHIIDGTKSISEVFNEIVSVLGE